MPLANTWSNTLTIIMVVLFGLSTGTTQTRATSEAPISSLEAFREVRAQGEATTDFGERAVYFRRALTRPEKHDEWLKLAKEFADALRMTYPPQGSPREEEYQSLLREIVRRFGHMGLYEQQGSDNAPEITPIIPNHETATLDDYIAFIAVLQDFHDRRATDWRTRPAPVRPDPRAEVFLDSPRNRISYGQKVEIWLDQRTRASDGRVFSEFELVLLDGTVRNCAHRFREQNDEWDSVPALAELGARFTAPAIMATLRKYAAIESPPLPQFALPSGSIIERTLHGDRLNNTDGAAKLDFDTGTVVANPIAWSNQPQQSIWMKRGGLDLEVDYHWDHLMSVVTFGFELFEVPGAFWEAAPATEEALTAAAVNNGCLQLVYGGDDQSRFNIAANTTLPATFAFRTREGGRGLLRLTAMREVAPNVREYDIQYRIDTPGRLEP